jgi:hypothetical protein
VRVLRAEPEGMDDDVALVRPGFVRSEGIRERCAPDERKVDLGKQARLIGESVDERVARTAARPDIGRQAFDDVEEIELRVVVAASRIAGSRRDRTTPDGSSGVDKHRLNECGAAGRDDRQCDCESGLDRRGPVAGGRYASTSR